MTAKIPSGCAASDPVISPPNNRATDLPRPHPGQNSIPAFFSGQTVKWLLPVSANARTLRPVNQTKASNGKRLSIPKDKHVGERVQEKSLLLGKRLFRSNFSRSDCHEASVEDGFVLIPKSGVTPGFEVVEFIG
jgi:hypothetical protein